VASSKPSPKLPSKQQPRSAGVPADLVIMGRLLAPRGIKGWLKVKTFTEEADALADFKVWWLKRGNAWVQCAVEDTELVHLGFSAKLQGVDDRNAAELMRGIDVALPRSEMPEYDDSIYWIDLIGLDVVNLAGEPLGVVDSLLETGANDVLVVKPAGEEQKEQLIPYTEQAVRDVDLKARKIVVDWQKDW
jgi:16S rRNA processing protein RimM